jgi:hypothetical protein
LSIKSLLGAELLAGVGNEFLRRLAGALFVGVRRFAGEDVSDHHLVDEPDFEQLALRFAEGHPRRRRRGLGLDKSLFQLAALDLKIPAARDHWIPK